MPSYRVTMTIGALWPHAAAPSVLPSAVEAAEALTTVEASGLAIVRGRPRISVRFIADDEDLARQIGEHVAASTGRLAEVPEWRVTARVGGRWQSTG